MKMINNLEEMSLIDHINRITKEITLEFFIL